MKEIWLTSISKEDCDVCSKDYGSKEDFNDHAGTVHERNLTNFNWIFVNSAEVGNIVDI